MDAWFESKNGNICRRTKTGMLTVFKDKSGKWSTVIDNDFKRHSFESKSDAVKYAQCVFEVKYGDESVNETFPTLSEVRRKLASRGWTDQKFGLKHSTTSSELEQFCRYCLYKVADNDINHHFDREELASMIGSFFGLLSSAVRSQLLADIYAE